MSWYRKKILEALESIADPIDLHTIKINNADAKELLTDSIEFYIVSKPVSIKTTMETVIEKRVRKHRFLHKIRFRNPEWKPGKSRKSTTVIPTTDDAFISIVSNISNLDINFWKIMLYKLDKINFLKEIRTEKAIAIKQLVKSHANSPYGIQQKEDLLKSARERTKRDLHHDLYESISNAMANGVEEEDIIQMMKVMIVDNIHQG